jgi:hypothetical protein
LKNKKSFFYQNSLSIVFGIMFLITMTAQTLTGWKEHNEELSDFGGREIELGEYFTSGHFLQSTFENWESEFLQMGLYVLFTVFLRQKGSSESKQIESSEDVDRNAVPYKNAPWPVKKGGLWLKLYENSLSIAFFTLFLLSFCLHLYGSLKDENLTLSLLGKPTKSLGEFLIEPKFWFESFQNWQSEFLSIISIVVLSIFLRQKGSPESKPVDAEISETGD